MLFGVGKFHKKQINQIISEIKTLACGGGCTCLNELSLSETKMLH